MIRHHAEQTTSSTATSGISSCFEANFEAKRV
jgi:hypothetical protein